MKVHVVYWIHDELGRLLYVGVTTHFNRRMRQHRSRSAWWGEAVSIDTQTFAARTEALAAEKRAIRSGSPKYNVRDNGVPFAAPYKPAFSYLDRLFEASA